MAGRALYVLAMNNTLPRVLAATLLAGAAVIGSVATTTPAPAQAASASVSCADPRAAAPITSPPLQSYTPITPQRLLDTRNNIGGLSAPLEAGCTIHLDVGADVPANVQAIALSVTAVSGEMDFITVYPCALGRPESSNVNYRGGLSATANLVVAIPDVNRQVCIYSHGRTEVIVDLEGWWSDGPDRFASVRPERVYDSRRPGFIPLEPDEPRGIELPTSVVPADATSVVVNLTTTNSTERGFFVAYPCGSPTPNASNLNFEVNEDRAVSAIVGIGSDHSICVVSNVPSDVIVDVNGYYSSEFGLTAELQPQSGTRIVDTRNAIGGPRQRFAAGEVRSFDLAGEPGATETSAVTLNVISSGASQDGFVTIYPCGGPVPDVSNLNYRAGQTTSNLATVRLASDRTICVYTIQETDIIIDLYGQMVTTDSLAEQISFDRDVFPPFDPAATDYAIKCGAGTTSVNMTLELLPGSTASLDAPQQNIGSGTVNRQLTTDQVLTLTLQRDSTQSQYRFRCLPGDFPDLTVQRPGQPTPGWYLTTFGANGSPGGAYSVIFDEYGAPVWYKRLSAGVGDFKRLPSPTSNPQLAYIRASTPFGVDPNAAYVISDLTGATPETVRADDPVLYPVDHHDYLEFTGGHTLLSYPTDDTADLTSLNPPVNNGPAPTPPLGDYTTTEPFADGAIIEETGGGTWVWRMSDHIPPAESTAPLRFWFMSPAVDVYHINSMDRLPDSEGNDYVLSARHLDAAMRVDRATGEIEWVLGGNEDAAGKLCAPNTSMNPTPGIPDSSKCLTVVGDPLGGPKLPHDARLQGDVLTLMDNRTDSTGPSRVVAYRIDATDMTATLLWEIRNPGNQYGGTLGSGRQADDGSVLVNWGAPIQPIYQEFAADGTPLMSISQSPFGYSYRIVKYPKSDFDINQLRATAGGAMVVLPA